MGHKTASAVVSADGPLLLSPAASSADPLLAPQTNCTQGEEVSPPSPATSARDCLRGQDLRRVMFWL